MNPDREPIPPDVAAKILFLSDQTCCKCREHGKSIQLHHVDGDRSNSVEGNLAVLCLQCHDDTHISGGFGRKFNQPLVIQYRDDWFERVKLRRDEADKLAISKYSAKPATVQSQSAEIRTEVPQETKLASYIQALPAIKKDAYQRAHKLWDTGNTPNMRRGCYDVIDVFELMLSTLLTWFPKNHFADMESQEYVSQLIASRYKWHRSRLEPTVKNRGTMHNLDVASSVMEDLNTMVEQIALPLILELHGIDPDAWRTAWRAT
jgi:hypothetical protein